MKRIFFIPHRFQYIIILLLFHISLSQNRIYPEEYFIKDLFFEENDKIQNYDYSLIDAKVLTKEEITLYSQKQGIHFTRDSCCQDMETFDAWTSWMTTKSDFKEIYSNAKYNPSSSRIEYDFPVDKIENKGYGLYHKLYIFDKDGSNPNVNVYLRYKDSSLAPENITPSINGNFYTIKITCESKKLPNNEVVYINRIGGKELKGPISSIIFENQGKSYSPAIALHWTYLKMEVALSNNSLKGNTLCDTNTNPCISGYYCIGGVCKKCHPSCFDCVNGALSTDCYSKCNTHSVSLIPNSGSCSIGYVDLNQFEDFQIENIIPPPRNNRLTISFWMYVNTFPEQETYAFINNTFSETIDFQFKFETNKLTIYCANPKGVFNSNGVITSDILNSWFFVKCAVSFDKSTLQQNSLYIKAFNGKTDPQTTVYINKENLPRGNNACSHDLKKYYEPDDYISLSFLKFNKLTHSSYTCNVYMKQLVLFREFLPEPYDNKYFSMEKLISGNTLELPEILFIIPFDELKKGNNLYKIKAYSYQGSVEVNEIILNPKESGDKFTLYPPKLFKRLNLLEKNKKFATRELLSTTDITLGSNVLIGSFDNVPLSCEDRNFLHFDITNLNINNASTYVGTCGPVCPSTKSVSVLFGLGDTKGFCNRDCSNDNSKCDYTNNQLLNLKENFECNSIYYNMFYNCEEDDEAEKLKNIFYYDPNYSPGNIVLDLRHHNLNSYIIEFWYFTADCGKITSGYVFYTDQIQIRRVETALNIYTTAHGIRTDFDFNEGFWNQIVLEVYYDPREERNNKTKVYLQTNLNSGNAILIDNSENNYKLNYIYFCNGRRASCNNLDLDWFCGYYKNLRLFNGNLAQRHVTYRYDEYYPNNLLSSILLYLPLYGDYISNNILTQYKKDLLSPFTITYSSNTWNFPQYNYFCIENEPTCATNCINCFDNNAQENCYTCDTNANYFLKKSNGGQSIICDNTQKYVLKLPSTLNKNRINVRYDGERKGATVTFFIKIYGFNIVGEIDIINLGSHLKLSYNSNPDDQYFGLNLKSYIGSSEKVISNYYDFRKHFGLWTFISVATYDKTHQSFFPAMARFEVNQKKMPIVGPLDDITMGNIYFSDNIYALVHSLKIYNSYIIGTHSFVTNTDTNNNIDDNYLQDNTIYYAPKTSQADCQSEESGMVCVSEDNDLIPENSDTLNIFYPFESESIIASEDKKENCDSECDICIGRTEFNCSCNYINDDTKLFLGNVSDHFCKKFNYINFAKANSINIPITLTEIPKKYSLHFWVFAYSYIENVFKGLQVEWKDFTTVKVSIDSTNKYTFICQVPSDETNPIDFKMNEWNFLHCAVDYDAHKIFYTIEEDSYNKDYDISQSSSISLSSQLIITDLTDEIDWGVLFYKHIRLWSDAFQYSSFLSRIEITDINLYPSLLYQFNTKFNSAHKITDTKNGLINAVTYSSDKIGTNIVPEEIYQDVVDKPILCDKLGTYYDRKTSECVDFIELSDIKENIYIDKIDVAYSHNYAIAFWILMEDHTNIVTPIDIIWQYHMRISLKYNENDSLFKMYCFPQNYPPYSDILENSNSLEQMVELSLNSIVNESNKDLGGEWLWVQCSLSYNNRYFYLNENSKTLISETLFIDSTDGEVKNDEPLGYFFNDMDENLSSLQIIINKNRGTSTSYKKVYLRCLYLFKDYVPYNYNYKYMNMFHIDKEEFPPLTLAFDFADFDEFEDKTLNKIDIKYKSFASLDNAMSPYNKTLEFNSDPIKELSANFIFLPLCDPLTNEKYNSETNLCEEIEDCDPNALNCLYCMDEKKPLVCKTNYYINIDDEKDEVDCLNYCKGNFYRSPGTFTTQGICGTECISSDVLLTCPNTPASILSYQSDFACKTGYNRIGYQCFETPIEKSDDETKENFGALFYSGFNYPYNIYQSFTNDFISLIGNGYVLEFWFMIDNVIYDKSNYKAGEKYHYFLAKPHEVYIEDSIIYYRFDSRITAVITSYLHPYEWNKILIFADSTVSNKKEIRLVINFEKVEPTITVDQGQLTLTYIAFCSKDPELSYPLCVMKGLEVQWASAYYNNIRVWNIYTSTIDTIQSFINGIYEEYPQSIILYYPLTIQYLDNNKMTNIMGNLEEHIEVKCESGAKCASYNKDNIIIYNYSSKFDWALKHPRKFVQLMNGDNNQNINEGNCNEHCLRCYESDLISKCYECEKGYVLLYKECKPATKYFLKTPSGGTSAPYNLVLENDQGQPITNLKGFTIIFWIKFFGVPYSTITEYCSILSFDSNTYLAFQRSTNNLVLLENSKIVFSDANFQKYFGIWIPISIADFISNEQNDIYPNMFTLSVNKIDIPFTDGYTLPSTGIKVNQLQFGYEIIALYAELRIYSKFIQGGYGKIRSTLYEQDLFYYKPLAGTNAQNCIDSEKDLISGVSIKCSPDYSLNFKFDDNEYCNNDEMFYLPYDENNESNELKGDPVCYDCDIDTCQTLCFGEGDHRCTCDMTDGIYWLRRDTDMRTFCQPIPHFDFGNINAYKYTNAPMSKTKEYTIEFWLFVYSYNQVTMNFRNMYIEWNFHNRIRLYNEQNSLKVNCQPIWRDYDFATTNYPDVKQGSLKYYQWNYVRCGTDLKNKKYFLNSITEYDLKTKQEFFFDLKEEDKTQPEEKKYFTIYRGSDFLVNFGYVFIREIKLWQQYNLDFIDSQYIEFDLSKITVAEIKTQFPGLLLYYKNEFSLTEEDYNPVITEVLSGTSTIIGRDPNYIGYNVVDPNLAGYAPDFDICPYGQVHNELLLNKCVCPEDYVLNTALNICEHKDDPDSKICKIFSNLELQCFECKEDNKYLNKWLNEFDEECYLECPATTFEDDLINQCRRCHETCYECENENYNDCTSCTGELYYNENDHTCISNCQTAGLTRSLTRPNLCVVFDADASLVNVDTLTPIDINNFHYIEAKVINPTSSEYKTLWIFDVEETNKINKELGFDDIIPSSSSPFTGDKEQLNVALNTNFFKINHKYVFGMKIYAENEGVEVPVYVWWTLTMNAPPFNGKLTVMPYLGLYNTTTFIMRCVDFLDENTPAEDIEYDFYYIEVNTNSKIKLSNDFSLNNEVYSNFTVRYYQLEYSNITIYCQARDKFGAISEASNTITIVNQKNNPLYNLKQIIASFYIVDTALTDIQLLARAEVLMSLGINPFTTHVPEKFFTSYESSLTGEKVEMTDPQCIAGYCNDNGECQVIDVAMTCNCKGGYLGKECFLDKDGYTDLSYYYKKLYQRLIERLTKPGTSINDHIFNAFYKLFFAAQKFFQEESFFETNMVEFKNWLKEEGEYIVENKDRINKIFDLNEFFFNFYYIKENQIKLQNKINENYPFRNRTLTVSEYSVYQTGFQKFFEMIDEDTIFLIKKYGQEYIYETEHFSYYLLRIDENFDDEEFFESLKTVWVTYKPIVLFMKCLREKKESFDYFFNYVEYNVNPLSYENQFYPNITSPLISIKIYTSLGTEVPIRNCPSNTPIKIYLPFNSYDWINYINEQKWLFLPENYKIETDPVFRDPILIWENGSVSDDTVEERILKYYRYYNIVGLVYTPSSLSLYEYTSLLFKNISDSFLLIFETNHFSAFTSMLIPNIMNFVVDGRFYYMSRYEVLLCLDNHIHNPVFYIWASFLALFILISVFFAFYDYNYFDNLEILDFLKKEIIKVHFPYNQLKFGLNDENVYKLIPKESKLKKGSNKQYKKMFKEYDLEGINEGDEDDNNNITDENQEDINEKEDPKIINKIKELDIYSSTRNRLTSQNENKNEDNFVENELEKATALRTSKNVDIKKKKKDKKDKNQISNKSEEIKDGPPKKKRNILSNVNSLSDNISKKSKSKKDKKKIEFIESNKDNDEDKKEDLKEQNGGYGDNNDVEDFNEDMMEQISSSDKNTKNMNLPENLSKFTGSSKSSLKRYYYGKYGTKANLISLQRFHNKAGRTNVDNDGIPLDIINEEEERAKAIIAFKRLSVSTFIFFSYNLKVRHILVAPFLNLTLFNNRWKKLMVLLTQVYIMQLIISVALTMNENITISNFLGMIVICLIACLISDAVIYLCVFLFQSSNYQRKRLYRLVMMGENFTVTKAWNKLKRQMNFKLFFGLIIAFAIWAANFYITLIFTSVWKYQRSAWICCFFLSLIMDLLFGEILIEGITAIFYSRRAKSDNMNIIGEILNRLRAYRTMWP